jgi:hypothetical protein
VWVPPRTRRRMHPLPLLLLPAALCNRARIIWTKIGPCMSRGRHPNRRRTDTSIAQAVRACMDWTSKTGKENQQSTRKAYSTAAVPLLVLLSPFVSRWSPLAQSLAAVFIFSSISAPSLIESDAHFSRLNDALLAPSRQEQAKRWSRAVGECAPPPLPSPPTHIFSPQFVFEQEFSLAWSR